MFPAQEPGSLTMIIAQNVQRLMVTRGVTQVKLAAAMELSQTSISKRLRGIIPWDATDMDKLRRIFGVSAAELVSELPRLDSNQQPADSREPQVATVLAFRRPPAAAAAL